MQAADTFHRLRLLSVAWSWWRATVIQGKDRRQRTQELRLQHSGQVLHAWRALASICAHRCVQNLVVLGTIQRVNSSRSSWLYTATGTITLCYRTPLISLLFVLMRSNSFMWLMYRMHNSIGHGKHAGGRLCKQQSSIVAELLCSAAWQLGPLLQAPADACVSPAASNLQSCVNITCYNAAGTAGVSLAVQLSSATA